MEEGEDNKVNSTINAVSGLVKAIPVYQDTLQPAAKQVGKSLETIAKAVNIGLVPIKALVWGYEQIEEYLNKRLSEKLKNVPEGNIITPPPNVAGPAIEALRYSGHDDNLRELFANLLATAMDKVTANSAHPAYVEVLKNITSDEAILLKQFIKTDELHPLLNIQAKKSDGFYKIVLKNLTLLNKIEELNNPDLVPAYIDNLVRLGILNIPSGVFISEKHVYDNLKNDACLIPIKQQILEMGREMSFEELTLQVTTFGKQFILNVVLEKN